MKPLEALSAVQAAVAFQMLATVRHNRTAELREYCGNLVHSDTDEVDDSD